MTVIYFFHFNLFQICLSPLLELRNLLLQLLPIGESELFAHVLIEKCVPVSSSVYEIHQRQIPDLTFAFSEKFQKRPTAL